MPSQTCTDLIEVAKLLLPATLIIAGWVIVHKLTVEREIYKARREILAKSADDLCTVVDNLFELANEYHSSDRDSKLEMKIKITQSDLSQRVCSLMQISSDNKSLTNCLATVVKLRQAISGRHFEDEHLGPISNGFIQEEIAGASLSMKRCLVELKHSQFPLPSLAR
jgi:hypothetical protein